MIPSIGSTDAMVSILERGMATERLRASVIANNIVNADVPGFKRSDVSFEKQLLRAVRDTYRSSSEPFPAHMTHTRHIPFYVPQDWSSVNPKVDTIFDTTYNNNGSNVDPDLESVYEAKTAERYIAMTSFIDRHFRMIRSVMR